MGVVRYWYWRPQLASKSARFSVRCVLQVVEISQEHGGVGAWSHRETVPDATVFSVSALVGCLNPDGSHELVHQLVDFSINCVGRPKVSIAPGF